VADPAAAARRARLADARLYLCTPDRPDLADFLDAVLSGGVDVVQLREKGVEARGELRCARSSRRPLSGTARCGR
jgi:thiamine monophosphate synthase